MAAGFEWIALKTIALHALGSALPRNPAAAMLFALLLAACIGLGAASSAMAGPAPRPETWSIPSSRPNLSMQATLFRPAGKGPFPLAIINHGSEEDARVRMRMAMPSFPALTAWLLARGYVVVLPERPGHGATGGSYLESQGACLFPDYVKAGLGAAASISATINFMVGQSFVRPTGVLVIGNSAGGWGALALASQNPRTVAGIINFAGGRGGRNQNKPDNNCAPDRLVTAAGVFGKSARIPTLWLYANNDSYFSPALAGQMEHAFVAAGGVAALDILPDVPGDGHALINSSPAAGGWEAPVRKFIDSPRR
jgi:dienelactone hydrolase